MLSKTCIYIGITADAMLWKKGGKAILQPFSYRNQLVFDIGKKISSDTLIEVIKNNKIIAIICRKILYKTYLSRTQKKDKI